MKIFIHTKDYLKYVNPIQQPSNHVNTEYQILNYHHKTPNPPTHTTWQCHISAKLWYLTSIMPASIVVLVAPDNLGGKLIWHGLSAPHTDDLENIWLFGFVDNEREETSNLGKTGVFRFIQE